MGSVDSVFIDRPLQFDFRIHGKVPVHSVPEYLVLAKKHSRNTKRSSKNCEKSIEKQNPVGKAIWGIPNRLTFQICIELKTLRPVACA